MEAGGRIRQEGDKDCVGVPLASLLWAVKSASHRSPLENHVEGLPPWAGGWTAICHLLPTPTPTMPCDWGFTWLCLPSQVVLVWTPPEAREKALGQDTPKRGCKHAGEHRSYMSGLAQNYSPQKCLNLKVGWWSMTKLTSRSMGYFYKMKLSPFEEGLYCRKVRTSS